MSVFREHANTSERVNGAGVGGGEKGKRKGEDLLLFNAHLTVLVTPQRTEICNNDNSNTKYNNNYSLAHRHLLVARYCIQLVMLLAW